MQGILDNQYNILSFKEEGFNRLYYTTRHNQTQTLNIIGIQKGENNNNNNIIPANEINILNILNNANNPNILRYIGNGNGPLVLNGEPPRNVPYIVFENAPKFSLFEYIIYGNIRFSEIKVKLIFKKILNGIRAIHNANICHGDIKPEYILFDENYNPKIGFFELSLLNANNIDEFIGTKRYCAPEKINLIPYNGIQADIFSLGQTLFMLKEGILAFESSENADEHYSLIAQNNIVQFWNLPKFQGLNLSQGFKDLFIRMVSNNPNQRPTIDQILNDPWMQEINNLNEQELATLENEIKKEFHIREAQIIKKNIGE